MSRIFPLDMAGYGVVYADPPWQFDLRSERGDRKSPQAHYACMPTDDICALRQTLGLDFVCAEHCVLVMWATFPMLPHAFKVMAAWGFKYKSGGTWLKKTTNDLDSFGPGYLYRSSCEPWLLGTRGAPQILSRSERNSITAKTRGHSVKPDEMYRKIERQFHGPYLELFARRQRKGWDSWGNELQAEEGVAA